MATKAEFSLRPSRHRRMLSVLARPLPMQSLLMLAILLVLAATLYCVVYCAIAFPPMHGMRMPLSVSAAWAFSVVTPWLFCFELSKRTRSMNPAREVLVVATIFAGSGFIALVLNLGLAELLGAGPTPLSIDLAHLMPAASVTAMLVMVARMLPPVLFEAGGFSKDCELLCDDAEQIVWIRAAGNYVEVRRNGRTSVHRTTMQRLERDLAPAKFIRIHRQVIVNADCIESLFGRGTPTGLRLLDGTTFKVGSRYSSNLACVDA